MSAGMARGKESLSNTARLHGMAWCHEQVSHFYCLLPSPSKYYRSTLPLSAMNGGRLNTAAGTLC